MIPSLYCNSGSAKILTEEYTPLAVERAFTFMIAPAGGFYSDVPYTGIEFQAALFRIPGQSPFRSRRRNPMKKIGVLFGQEHSFPGALVERINAKHPDGIHAEFVLTGAVQMESSPRYAVIIDRISHDIPFYRAFLKHAALHGTVVINNPFWSSADDKFFNYSLARQLGVLVPPTVALPHKLHPGETTDRSMRNLEFPLDWESVFAYVGEHGFMKPIDGGGWRDVHHVRNREEFFRAYDQALPVYAYVNDVIDVVYSAAEGTDRFVVRRYPGIARTEVVQLSRLRWIKIGQ